jgi:anti-sigma regulatory factor (Ser/Thr protein kinase)
MTVVRILVESLGDVLVVQRAARSLAQASGFDGRTCQEVAILASELSCNILRHAGRGELSLAWQAMPRALRVEASDQGPGILDFEAALRDGWSDRGPLDVATSPGFGVCVGLGAVKRLSDAVEYLSDGRTHTVVAVRHLPQAARRL